MFTTIVSRFYGELDGHSPLAAGEILGDNAETCTWSYERRAKGDKGAELDTKQVRLVQWQLSVSHFTRIPVNLYYDETRERRLSF